MPRVVVTLCPAESKALVKLALTAPQSPRDQARYILRRELERLGLIQAAGPASTAQRREPQQEKPDDPA